MQTLARFATRYRWYVVAGWIALIIGVQTLASAAGGSSYKDVFTLPHTETQTVLDLLRANGQDSQAGQVGTIVVHAETGKLSASQAPAGLTDALQNLCADGDHVASVMSPWGAVDCSGKSSPQAAPAGHNPYLSTDDTVGLITVAWQYNENDVSNFAG